jgi:DNA-binding NarL/FixJ family response regulator
MEQNFNSMKKPNIIIVDDHLIFRQGLTALISGQNIACVIGEASNGKEYLELLITLKPDLVLMDIDMPHMNGMEATEKSLALHPDLKIIAFTMFSDEDYYYKMIDLGVRGFILKSSGILELKNAIAQVMNGDSYFSNELLRKIINRLGRKNRENPEEKIVLTEREMEILQHICLGLTNDEIAQKLFISTKTVKRHRANLLEKTMCKNTPSLILYAIKNKLVNL